MNVQQVPAPPRRADACPRSLNRHAVGAALLVARRNIVVTFSERRQMRLYLVVGQFSEFKRVVPQRTPPRRWL